MAVVIGDALCVLCGQPLGKDHDTVFLPPFELNGGLPESLSAAACHFRCLRDRKLLGEAEKVFLASAGDDGIKPIGDEIRTLGPSCRMEWSPRWSSVTLWYGPLLLVFQAPLASLKQLHDGPGSEALGIELSVNRRGESGSLRIATCGHSMCPSEADARTVQIQTRDGVSHAELDAFLQCLWSSVAAVTET